MMLSPFSFDPPSPSPSPRGLDSAISMTSALSPSISHSQFNYQGAGHHTFLDQSAAISSSRSIYTSRSMMDLANKATATPRKTPSKRKSKAAGSAGRPGRSSNKMEVILNSQAPADHDRLELPKKALKLSKSATGLSSKPLIASSSQTTLSDLIKVEDDSNVLQTPRRGRRLGGVDMGWGLPIARDDSGSASCPHTLPKASRTQASSNAENDVFSTPTKRKASTGFSQNPKAPQKTLIDNEGWASAAMLSAVPLSTSHASPGFSPRDATATTPRQASPRLFAEAKDPLSNFSTALSPVVPMTPQLVPLEVAGLGRVAVHRELASQISEQGPYESASAAKRHHSFSNHTSGLMRGADSEASSAGSSLGSSTNPTSVGTPYPSGPSPIFSLLSQFPPSEPNSPCKKTAVARQGLEINIPPKGSEKLSTSAQAALREIIRISPGAKLASTDLLDNACWRPRLGGSQTVMKTSLPDLDWPDFPAGPWAAAGQHVNSLKQQRREGIQKWLKSDLNDETSARFGAESGSSSYQHHPMVAKVLLDRVRKQNLEALLIASSASQVSPNPRKRARKSGKTLSQSTTPARRGRKPKTAGSEASSRRSIATGASLARSERSVVLDCKCGIDDGSIMVQCDHCHRWLHLPCVGISHADELDDEWFCDDCCSMISHEHLSPASSLPATVSSLADLSTPQGIQAALSMCEPVFALPSETPMHQRGAALSHSIALAPSPPMLSIGQHQQPRSSIKRQGVGRSRAERVGWRVNEPGSPLARKSTTASGVTRSKVPEKPSKLNEAHLDLTDAVSTPSFLAGFSRADWEPVRTRASDRHTTPSPRLINMSTPSRHASSRRPNHAGGVLSFGHHADVFSTPSRLTSGGSWSHHAHPGNQTPSRSGGRHQRVDSFTGTFSTPGRDFLGGAFGTEHSTVQSGGMPSLVYSSGGLDAVDDHFMDGGYNLARAWQMQSPTSTTRAVRARQISGYGTPSSSALLRTPELQPRQVNTSSLRGNRLDSYDPPTSSSPFPRTPTFDVDSPKFSGADRDHLGLGLPTSSSGRLGKTTSSATAERNLSTGKNRQVSSEMPLGLGIGFDLDDVLDWS